MDHQLKDIGQVSSEETTAGLVTMKKEEEEPLNIDEMRFQVVDKDTGQVFRIDEMEQHININAYTLFPSRDELAQRLATAGAGQADSDDDSTSPRGGFSSSGLSNLSNFLGIGKRHESKQQLLMEGQIRVNSSKKEGPDFPDLKLAQCLQAHEGPIWTMKFSIKGEFLATAGQSGVVYVWCIGGAKGNGGDDTFIDEVSTAAGADILKLLRPAPHRKFTDHTADVIDVSWNKENFLLSASIDKTVRLWHTARAECLHVYPHVDCVTSVEFHPKLDHIFISGNFDKKLRVWNITDGRVKEWANTPDMITAACFNPEGNMAVAGLYRGQVFFYQTEGMKYYTQVECRNRHGALKGGKKVTGLCYDTSFNSSKTSPAAEQLLITTNDSRLRLYQTEDYSMVCKYKGLTNDHMQIKATFSEDGKYVISGSENGNVYIWKGTTPQNQGGLVVGMGPFKKDRNTCYDFFTATEMGGTNPPIVSVALFVPAAAIVHAAREGPHETHLQQKASCINQMIITSDYAGKIRVFQRHSLTSALT